MREAEAFLTEKTKDVLIDFQPFLAFGNQIARIQTSHPVENIQWTGDDLKTLWLVGIGGFTKVEFDLAGPDLATFYSGDH